MKQQLKTYLNIVAENISERVIPKVINSSSLADNIAYRVALETMINSETKDKTPNELFAGITDDFWFWLNTEGNRRSSTLRNILPKLPDDYTQEMCTGDKGDSTLRDGFNSYQIFKEQYEKYRGTITKASNILDFGSGWGRIIRYFLKDVPPSKIWGCDPVEEMIILCKEQNKWCNFVLINTAPPTSFQNNTFDLIYSFSVFSHLSEDLHLSLLAEMKRILAPGGIFMATTRNRGFIKLCNDMRENKDLDSLNPGPRSSATAFPDTQQSQLNYDNGNYCHYSFAYENWPFLGRNRHTKKLCFRSMDKEFYFS